MGSGLFAVSALATALIASIAAAGESREQVIQRGHTGDVTCVALSPGGDLVASGSKDDSLRLWDAGTGEELRALLGHDNDVLAVAFSQDGDLLASGGRDGLIRLWSVGTGEEVGQLDGHSFAVTSLAFSDDGATLLSGSEDHTAIAWDLVTGEPGRQIAGRPDYPPLTSVAVSADGRMALLGGHDGEAWLFDMKKGRLHRSFPHGDDAVAVALSDDASRVFVGGTDGRATLWDASSGQLLLTIDRTGGDVRSVAISDDGATLFLGSGNGTARVVDAADGTELRRLGEPGRKVAAVAFSPVSQRVVLATGEEVWGWDVAGSSPPVRFGGRTIPVWSALAGEDGALVLTAGERDLVQFRVTPSATTTRRFSGWTPPLWIVATSADGRWLSAGVGDGDVMLWDAWTGERRAVLDAGEGAVEAMVFSRDGRRLATATASESCVRLWDVETGRPSGRLEGHSRAVTAATFSPDSETLLTGSWDGTARLWDLDTAQERVQLVGHQHRVGAVAIAPDGRMLATGSGDNTVRLWNPEDGEELLRLRAHEDGVQSLAFSAAGGLLISGGGEGTARLWRVADGKVTQTLKGHLAAIEWIEFGADGKRAITCSEDGTARTWDLADGRILGTIVAGDDGSWATVDPAGRYESSVTGHVRGVHWVDGAEAIAMDQGRARYHTPGLLTKLLAGTSLEDVPPFALAGLPPSIELAPPASGQVEVTLADRGGGIGHLHVFVNGREYADVDAGSPASDGASTVQVEIGDALSPGRTNHLRLVACCDDGSFCGRGVEASWSVPGTFVRKAQELWAVVVGLGTSDTDELRSAPTDARAFAEALRNVAGTRYGPSHTHLSVMPGGEESPSRDALRGAFEAAEQAAPDDILVVYITGFAVAGPGDAYGFVPPPSGGTNDRIDVSELLEWAHAVPARNRLFIADTCLAGPPLAELDRAPPIGDQPSDAALSLHQVGGFQVLLGRTSDRSSFEANPFGQGLLTRAVIEVLREGPTDARHLVTAVELRLPELAGNVPGVRTPVALTSAEGAFDLGRPGEAIVLPGPRPILLRPRVTWRGQAYDALELGDHIREVLHSSLQGPDSPALYVDATGLSGGLQPDVEYTVDDGEVMVKVAVERENEELLTFEASGARAAMEGLASEIAGRLVELASASSP